MTQKTTIAIDIDDVVADSTETLRHAVNRKHGVELTKEHYRIKGKNRRYYEYVWETNGLGGKAAFDDFHVVMTADQSHVELVEGAEKAVGHLKERFHLVFITARPVEWDGATRRWFTKHFGGDIELHFSQGYFNERGKTKGELCKELGAKWLIDDVPENCQSAVQEGVNAILFGDYGWSEDVPGALRCHTWAEVEERLLHVG